jgi:hypothetical protein
LHQLGYLQRIFLNVCSTAGGFSELNAVMTFVFIQTLNYNIIIVSSNNSSNNNEDRISGGVAAKG